MHRLDQTRYLTVSSALFSILLPIAIANKKPSPNIVRGGWFVLLHTDPHTRYPPSCLSSNNQQYELRASVPTGAMRESILSKPLTTTGMPLTNAQTRTVVLTKVG